MAEKKVKVKKENGCSVFPIIVLVIGVLWLLTDLGVFTLGISWWPIIIILLGIGMITKHGKCKC